jgi:hypothetical protein
MSSVAVATSSSHTVSETIRRFRAGIENIPDNDIYLRAGADKSCREVVEHSVIDYRLPHPICVLWMPSRNNARVRSYEVNIEAMF